MASITHHSDHNSHADNQWMEPLRPEVALSIMASMLTGLLLLVTVIGWLVPSDSLQALAH